MGKNEIDKESIRDFEEIWKPLLYTKGELDAKKVRREMLDLIFIFNQVSRVYVEITGNKLSKPMYYAETIIGEYHDRLQEAYDEGRSDCKKEVVKEEDRIGDRLIKLSNKQKSERKDKSDEKKDFSTYTWDGKGDILAGEGL